MNFTELMRLYDCQRSPGLQRVFSMSLPFKAPTQEDIAARKASAEAASAFQRDNMPKVTWTLTNLIGVMGPEVVQQLAAEHEHEQLDASQDGEQLSKSERENLIRRLTSAWAHTPEIVRIRNDQDLLRGALAAIVMPDGRVCSGSCPQRPSILSAVAVLNELNENFNKEFEMVADRMEKIAAEKKADSTAEAAEAAMRLVSTTARNIRGAKNEAKNGTINKGTYIKLSQLQSLGDFSVGDKRPADTTGESSQKESYLAQPRLRPMGCANTSEDRNKSYKTTNL